jgi:hypothetical protein
MIWHFSLSRLKYSISIVADKGLKKSLYTSARLKKGEVIYLETHFDRYKPLPVFLLLNTCSWLLWLLPTLYFDRTHCCYNFTQVRAVLQWREASYC